MPPLDSANADSSPADTSVSADVSGSSQDTSPPSSPSSSPANADSQAPASTSPGEQTASPPDAPVVDDRTSLLDAVRKVVEAKPENSGSEGKTAPETKGPQDKDQSTQAATPDTLEADPTDAELAGLVPKTKARIEKLLKQRNDARTEIDALKPAVQKWQQMERYLTKHDLAPQDVNLLLGIGAALRRGDFKAFREGVKPYLDLADQALGLALPADLQAKVDQGELSADAARELSTTRFANARLQGQAQQRAQADQAAEQRNREAQTVQAVSSAVTQWEQTVQARDPDYAKVAPVVMRFSQALVAERGRPTTPEAAVKLAEEAYAEAKKLFRDTMPRPQPTAPDPSGARAVSGNRQPEPRSLMEAARLALERTCRG